MECLYCQNFNHFGFITHCAKVRKNMLLLGALKKALKAYLYLNGNLVGRVVFLWVQTAFSHPWTEWIFNRSMSLYVCWQSMIVYVSGLCLTKILELLQYINTFSFWRLDLLVNISTVPKKYINAFKCTGTYQR